MGKQIQFDDSARDALRRGVDQLAGAVRVTLGPRGRNVVIDRRDGAPTITNDGFTILREIELENPFENMGAQLVKEVATRTGEVAGDGTTTATVLAHMVVAEGLKAIAAGSNPMALKRGIERAVAAVVEELRKQSQTVRGRDDLARVATVSSRNDTVMGALIADALDRVGREGVVTVEEGRGMETTLEVVDGLRLDRGYLSPYFVTDPERMEVALDNPLVLITDQKISAVKDLLAAMEHAAEARRPLLVLAEDVEGEALATMVVNRLRGTVASVAIRAPWEGGDGRATLDDLAILTGAQPYTREDGRMLERFQAAHFGRAKRVLVDRDSATLLEGGGRGSEIRSRVEQVRRELDEAASDYDRDRLRRRLGRLIGGVARIHVGAPTELELKERKARVEDALAATRAALEEGVVAGGGVALLRAQPAVLKLRLSDDERVGQAIVSRALEEPARQIAINAGEEGAVVVEKIRAGRGGYGYNALAERFEDLIERGVVDATKVVRAAVQNAASIGSLVLTTDAIVVESPDDDETETEKGEPEAP
jgi:chaperonin GroEL